MLAQGVPDDERTRTFARYSLIGALSMAAGSLAAALPDFMTSAAGLGEVTAFRIMFYVYGGTRTSVRGPLFAPAACTHG